ncbi:hypothetical protein QYE76_026934, partial [Lolium multiflorum]
MARYAEGLLYANGEKSGPSAYGLARPACQNNSRRSIAVGAARSTPRETLGIPLALGVDGATPTATLSVGHPSNLSNFVKIITNSYDVRKMRIRYEEGASIAQGGEEQLDKKLDMELDMKISHGCAREERDSCAKKEEVQAGVSDEKIVNQKNKDAADVMTWREYEALRNEMRREFRVQDEELKETIDGVSKKLDTTNEIINAMQDQMTDIQRDIQALTLAVENLTQQQQHHEDENVELQDEAPGVGRGNRGRGFVELGRHGHGFEEEDELGKPKFSIPKFEGGADVEEYLTWELKIEKLWRLHTYTEDRKVKLASSEFDGYALCWWDGVTRTRQEDHELPVHTWQEMKAIMQARFVPTNYLRSIYDKLTLLRQGVKTVDTYFMEMEMLMQRGCVRESLQMTIQRFLHGLKYDIKGIVRRLSYTTMNELLHHTREAEAHLAEEAQIKGRATGAGSYTPRTPPSTAPMPSSRSAPYSTPSRKPVSNVSNTRSLNLLR